jgi:hypothetical protein
MSMAPFNSVQVKNHFFASPAARVRRFAKHLVAKWQGISNDRQQLWHAYDDSCNMHSTPRCVWRRHGALLMCARQCQRQKVASTRMGKV